MPEPENIYGVDLAMGPSGDLVINSAGALTAVGGVQVVAQALLLRIRTALGDLALHPAYGLNLPTGGKMEPVAVAAALNGGLSRAVANDPRIQSATVSNVEWPANATPTAIALEVTVTLAGGQQFAISGLPAEVRVGEVSYTGNSQGESGLTPFEEAPYFADEETTVAIERESEIESLTNDLGGT
jgi:hypothetical protein